jgi:hypothetical protein
MLYQFRRVQMEAELANKGFHWVAGRASVERSHQLRINNEDVWNREPDFRW